MERWMRKVEVISRKRVFDDVFKIEEARLRFERYDGTMSKVVRRLNFERGDSAAALLVNREEKRVYLTEQFKYPSLEKGGGWIVEVVAGKIDAGETAEQAIKREIMEELGFQVSSVEPIANFFVSPGGTSERIFLFGAVVSRTERTGSGGGLASENEDIKMVEWSVDEFLTKTQAGQLADAKTIIAGYWLKENYTRIMRT
jgi:nudix-type nucleoside diphosphatase (YffH/AdpP family)